MKKSFHDVLMRRILGLVMMCILLGLLSCVVPSEEAVKFKEDSFLTEEAIRDRLARNESYDSSIGYMSYAISVGEVVLVYDYELEETIKFEMDDKPMQFVLGEESGEVKYRQKHKALIHLRTQLYAFNDYETELWLSSLLSSMSYIVDARKAPDDITGVSSVKVGKIFIQTLLPYLESVPNQLLSIRSHPAIDYYFQLIGEKATEEEIDIYYSALFNISADSLYLIPRDGGQTEADKENLIVIQGLNESARILEEYINSSGGENPEEILQLQSEEDERVNEEVSNELKEETQEGIKAGITKEEEIPRDFDQ